MTLPPMIVHVGFQRTDNLCAIATDAAAALHMSKGERALFCYYAAQSSGFRPALQAVANATGQNRAQVWRNRAALIAHGVAMFQDDRFIIDWGRAKIFSSLDPRLTSKHCTIAPVGSIDLQPQRISLHELKYGPLETLIQRLAALTDIEFAALRRRMKGDRKRVLPRRNQCRDGSIDLRRAV